MERAQAKEILAALFELHMTADDVDDVDAGEQVLDEALRDHGSRKFTHRASTAAALCRRLAADDARCPTAGQTRRALLSAGIEAVPSASRCLTSAETRLMSARPASRGLTNAITLPMACGPGRPTSAMAASMMATTSASDSLLRQVAEQQVEFGLFLVDEIVAAGLGELLDRILALLDQLLDDRRARRCRQR